MTSLRWLFRALAACALFAAAACGPAVPNAATPADLDQLRASAKGSTDPDTLGRWLLEEMLAPGGTRDGGKRRAPAEQCDRGGRELQALPQEDASFRRA